MADDGPRAEITIMVEPSYLRLDFRVTDPAHEFGAADAFRDAAEYLLECAADLGEDFGGGMGTYSRSRMGRRRL